jgi:hypothetical protein
MNLMQSVCIYHNGNSKILQQYKDKFSHLTFSGNLAESVNNLPSHGHLWEICFADATRENLIAAVRHGVFILRHISTYRDDMDNLLPECERVDYNSWLTHVVANNLCVASQVVSELTLDGPVENNIAIITTGRTANKHLQLILNQQGYNSFEYSKTLDQQLFDSASAVLLWRKDQWECLTSNWFAMQTNYANAHQLANQPLIKFDHIVESIPQEWINTEWINLCQAVLDHAMFYLYVCCRPITYTTTEFITESFQSDQQKLSYNKEQLIDNCQETKQYYRQSGIAELLEMLYTNVTKHVDPWKVYQSKD